MFRSRNGLNLLVHFGTFDLALWEKIKTIMAAHPERLKVARTLLGNGLAIRKGSICLDDIEISTAKIARVAGVDRRTVGETIRMVERNSELNGLFSRLQSAGLSLRGVAKDLGFGVVEIIAEDPIRPGMLPAATKLLSGTGISIRQALVDDPELAPEPKLVLIAGRPVPGELIPEFLKIGGVTKVSIY